ncbi:Gti1/Pac2 family-domain-containing protein [Dichotomocladium elegans]|nr:Gti1/Pac2 family-domain-containing protein [Dichotomocladium elegans]
METYIGYIKSPHDALIILEACRRGQLNRVQRRLSTKERTKIKSGSVFAWDEGEAGMRRWTDGRTWSPSRVLGSFLTYRELDMKHRHSPAATKHNQQQHRQPYKSNSNTSAACAYKTDGLIKQSFSICTATHQKLHLISYYSKADVQSGRLRTPSADPALKHISIPKGLYPELNPLDTSGGHSAALLTMRSYPPSLSASPSLPHPPLAIQDIAISKLPFSEDQRQLSALRVIL